MSEKGSKGRLFALYKLENHTCEGKRRLRKGKSEEEEKKKPWLVKPKKKLFDGIGPFDGNIFKNPARYTLAIYNVQISYVQPTTGEIHTIKKHMAGFYDSA